MNRFMLVFHLIIAQYAIYSLPPERGRHNPLETVTKDGRRCHLLTIGEDEDEMEFFSLPEREDWRIPVPFTFTLPKSEAAIKVINLIMNTRKFNMVHF